MAATPLDGIDRAQQMYREGRHREALGFYTEALVMAKTKAQRIALHSNRAACYLKLHDFKKAAEECSSVLELDKNHTGALMLRAQTLVTLKEYHSALFDVNLLLELNPSSEVYQNLHARLKSQLSLAPIPECDAEVEEAEDTDDGNTSGEADELEYEDFHEQERGSGGEGNMVERDKEAGSERSANNAECAASRAQPMGWRAIPKPKGHSNLDYSRWDKVQDNSSNEDDDDNDDGDSDDDDCPPQYRFRVKTVGVHPVK